MAQTLLLAGEIWLWAGLAVALPFLLWGIDRVEPDARGAWAFRPLMLPGVMLVWPLVLWRWAVLERGWDDARRHCPPLRAQGVAALVMALAIPAIIALSLAARQDGPRERPALLLSPPEATE